MARTRLYRDGELVRENFPVGEISDRIAEPNAFVWLDYCAPTGEELQTIAQELQPAPAGRRGRRQRASAPKARQTAAAAPRWSNLGHSVQACRPP